jgi:hypothetical protein
VLAQTTDASPPGSDFEGPAYEFEQVREGIYHAHGTGNVPVGANATIVINENDVLVVDSHISPAAAAALLAELKAITDKPVKYVVNTHFHFDHNSTPYNRIGGSSSDILTMRSKRRPMRSSTRMEPLLSGAVMATMRFSPRTSRP